MTIQSITIIRLIARKDQISSRRFLIVHAVQFNLTTSFDEGSAGIFLISVSLCTNWFRYQNSDNPALPTGNRRWSL